MTTTSLNPTAEISSAHRTLISYYGLFMVAWSTLESLLQTAIMKELNISPTNAVIITGKLQFQPRAQLLINLLKENPSCDKEAIRLIQKMEGFAHRNTIVHGLIVVGDPERLTFVKYDGGGSVKQSFTPEIMAKHIMGLNERTEKLQGLLGILDSDLQLIGGATLRFANSKKQ